MADIVERLRFPRSNLMVRLEAAVEIERLRDALRLIQNTYGVGNMHRIADAGLKNYPFPIVKLVNSRTKKISDSNNPQK